jgi:UDP-N-acetylglucosamine:LPS N-acetylglucosamine transferase
MSEKTKLRICIVASSGGHLTQLLSLKESWQDYSVHYVSTSRSAAKKTLERLGRCYIVADCGRNKVFQLFGVAFQCFRILLKEKTDVVISGGSAPGCLMSIIGKMFFQTRVVWFDSIANVRRMSLSGRITRPFTDICICQWEELAKKYKGVNYLGTVI